jgi:acetolactate synthase-1/2/3 large subunit
MSAVPVLKEVAPPRVRAAVAPKVADVLVSYLAAEGVTCVFGVPGGNLVPFYEALADSPSVKAILSKHEEGGAFMADGYARVGHRLGACCGIAGPGATHALTGIAGAFADSSPVLLISGQVATNAFGRGAIQDSTGLGIDLVEMFRPITKMSAMIVNADSTPRIVEQALRTAWAGRPGPVHLNLPCDVATMPVNNSRPIEQSRYRAVSQSCDFLEVARAASQLSNAQRPAILAGNGVNLTGAWDELRYLSEGAGIPVATTPKGKGAFPENHPLSLGVFGFGGHQRATSYLTTEADALLVIGSSLGEFQTNAWDARLGARGPLIQIDIDPTNIGRNYPVSTSIVSDARMAIVAIDAELSKLSKGRRGAQALSAGILAIPPWLDTNRATSQAVPIKPQRMAAGLRRVLPDDALVFTDIGNSLSWMIQYFEVRQPGTFFLNLGLACMGWAGPASIGGQFAAPDQTVVAVMGDGAFAMTGLEIHTAVEHDLPVVWIVLNDSGFGMVDQGESLIKGRRISPSRYRQPINAAAVAQAVGATAFRVDAPDEFEVAVREAVRLRRPCLVDVRIDATEVPGTLRMRTESLRKMFTADDT